MIKHYVEVFHAGLIFSETYSHEVPSRDPLAVDLPRGAYAFRFYDQTEIEVGRETLTGDPRNYSARYIKGEKITLEEAKRLPDSEILVSNMEGNGWPYVVKCAQGCIPPQENEVFI